MIAFPLHTPSFDRLRESSRPHLRALAAVVLLLVGQAAPMAHAAWNDHAAEAHAETSVSADCSLCEETAARNDAAVLVPAAVSLLSPPELARGPAASTFAAFDERALGPNPARAPPVHS